MSKLSEQYRASVAKITAASKSKKRSHATSAHAGFRGRASSGSDAPSKSKSDSRSEIEKLEDELEQARNEDGGPSPRTRKLSKQLEELKAAKKSAPAKPAAKKSAPAKPAAKSNGVRKFLDSKKPVHTYNELVASPESIYELARRIATAVDSKVRLSARKKLAQVYDGMDSDARRRLLIGRLVSTQDLKSMSKYSKNIEKVLNNEGEPKCTRRDVTDNLELYRKSNKLRPDSAKFRKVLEDHGVVPATTEKPNTGKKPGPISKKPATDPATGKRYTKRGVTQMLKQLKEAQEKGRKDSAAYKQREADMKRLTKVLKTLSSADDVTLSVADQYRISTIAASLEDC